MDKIIIIGGVIFVVIMIVLVFVSAYLSKKRLKEIVEKLHLEEGKYYDVIVNNGTKRLNLCYSHIAYGKHSENGNINIYFTKQSKYRGDIITKEVMIKYGNIWKIYIAGESDDFAESDSDETEE